MMIKKKLKNQSGFSLAETLLAVLILLLVSVIVANGIPVAQNVYNNVIIGANAQMLLSTAVTALRNELGTARDVEVNKSDKTTITYFNSSNQAYSKISLSSDDLNNIVVDPYIDSEDKTSPLPGSEQRSLVSFAASNKDLLVTYDNATVTDDGVITFHGIEVKPRRNDGSTIVTLSEYVIRPIPQSAS